jgi:hypothetical protein
MAIDLGVPNCFQNSILSTSLATQIIAEKIANNLPAGDVMAFHDAVEAVYRTAGAAGSSQTLNVYMDFHECNDTHTCMDWSYDSVQDAYDNQYEVPYFPLCCNGKRGYWAVHKITTNNDKTTLVNLKTTNVQEEEINSHLGYKDSRAHNNRKGLLKEKRQRRCDSVTCARM